MECCYPVPQRYKANGDCDEGQLGEAV
ncbi:hypothetical protein A2U01_0109474, partial [Trifolium medium]|nr:hypothetical protein [Trifolium medium]